MTPLLPAPLLTRSPLPIAVMPRHHRQIEPNATRAARLEPRTLPRRQMLRAQPPSLAAAAAAPPRRRRAITPPLPLLSLSTNIPLPFSHPISPFSSSSPRRPRSAPRLFWPRCRFAPPRCLVPARCSSVPRCFCCCHALFSAAALPVPAFQLPPSACSSCQCSLPRSSLRSCAAAPSALVAG